MSGGGLGSAIIGAVPSWQAGGTMPISGWPMYGIELLIIGSQRNILLRLYIYMWQSRIGIEYYFIAYFNASLSLTPQRVGLKCTM